jgi:hypothetical protein
MQNQFAIALALHQIANSKIFKLCICQAAFVILMVCDGDELLFIVAVPTKRAPCFQS